MDNIITRIDGNKLVIEIDVTAPGTTSASGKSKVIASTHGNLRIEHPARPGLTIGVNVYVPNR